MSEKAGSYSNLILPLLVLGASGIVAQTVLLRELLILFAGNELSLGIIIGAWVACEALGSLSAGRGLRFARSGGRTFVLASLLFSLLFPLAIYLARIYKELAGIPAELGVGFGHLFAASFLVMTSVGFLHGFLFIGACSLLAERSGAAATAAGRVYFWETAGTVIGGIAVSYLLIPYLNSFQTALLMALANGFASLLLVSTSAKGKRLLPGGAAILFSLAVLVFLARGGAEWLQRVSLAGEWKGKEVVAYRNSFYQNIAVVRNEGQYTFFTDGVPLVTTPVPDIAYVEEFVHFPLLAHPAPASVLVLGGGAGGVIAEILRHPTVRRIDYVESDPALLQAIRDFPTQLTTAELANPLVHLHYGDPRLYLRRTALRYDIVLLNLPLPQTMQANRHFTSQCFAAIRGVMNKGGIFAMPVTGSLTYYTPQLKAVNASCLATIAAAFPHRLVVPGDTNLLLASADPRVAAVTPQLLAARLNDRKIAPRLITPEHLALRLDGEKMEWLGRILQGARAEVNRDFSPMGLYYNMAHRTLLFSPQLKGMFQLAGGITLPAAVTALLALLLLAFLLAARYPAVTVPAVISATGFSAMIFELLLFFGFQLLYGHVFQLVGVLTCAFMGGIATGSLAVTASMAKIRNDRRLLLLMECAIFLFAVFLAVVFKLFAAGDSAGSPAVYASFILLLIAAGFLTGMEFPLAVRLSARFSGDAFAAERSSGLIYGADLAGGFVGGLLGGTFLIPVLGFTSCCILVAVLKGGTLLLAVFAREA
ncbi:MAG TPA: hypothetical protein VF799_04425 [Geobacteraceae bacterium]